MHRNLTIALLALAVPAIAQDAPQPAMPTAPPGTMNISGIQAGIYAIDSAHAQVQWTVKHFGFNNYYGLFGSPTGTLKLDPRQPAASSLQVTIPIAEVATSNGKLTDHLKTPDFFNLAKYPTATFASTGITVRGTDATITGNLTMLGVTKPATLDAKFTGSGVNPFNKKPTIGFEATATVKRSEWGMKMAVPLVGDDVALRISAAFEKQ